MSQLAGVTKMVSTVKSRPNHYETLGLAPTASDGEIAEAFARQMGFFGARPVLASTQIAAAFETLREPVKRRAYDASIGLTPKVQPPAPPMPCFQLSIKYTGSDPVRRVARPAHDAVPSPSQPFPPHPEGDAAPQRAIGPASSRSSSERTTSAPPRQTQAEVLSWTKLGDPPKLRRFEGRPVLTAEDDAIEWRRTATAIGWPILGVAMFAAIAGWSAGLVEQSQPPEPGATVGLPLAKPLATPDLPPAPTWDLEQGGAARPSRAATSVTRIERAQVPVQEQRADASDPELRQTEEAQFVTAGEGTPPVLAAAAATMALPDRVVARTIGRIGYACGQVASTTPVEGAAPGVFKVTCTSGHSYQATPVHGRYRFRRWDR